MIVSFPTAEERARAKLAPSEIKLLDRANENAVLAVSIVWPELNKPTDYPGDLEELAGLEFDGVPEFRTDGIGAGTPEFRQKLEAFHTIAIASRYAIALLGHSRSELVEKTAAFPDTIEGAARCLVSGYGDLVRLARCVRAAEVRLLCAIALPDEQRANSAQ